MANPYDLANELVEALRQTKEYQRILQIQKEIEKNEKLDKMLNQYRAIQVEIQTLQLQGQQPSPEVEEKVKKLTDIIQEIPLLKQYLDAEEEFGEIFQDVQQIVMRPVIDLFENIAPLNDL